MSGVRIKPSRKDSVISLASQIYIPDQIEVEKNIAVGYFFAFLIIVTYTVAVVSAQLAVNSTPRFQLSLMRYVTQAIIALITAGICTRNLKVKKRKIWMMAIISVFDFIYNFSFYHAASYLPVGNMEGIFTALIILFLGVYDLARKKCSVYHVVSGIICTAGLILLVQPWTIAQEINNTTFYDTIPCEAFGKSNPVMLSNQSFTFNEADKSSMSTTSSSIKEIRNNLFNASIQEEFPANQSFLVEGNNSDIIFTTEAMTIIPQNMTDINSTDSSSQISDVWIGYVLILSASISMSVISIFVEKLTVDHHPTVISFWLSTVNSVVSAILMASMESPSLPDGLYCILFTFLLTTLSALNAIFSHVTLSYLLPSQTALILSLSMVVLFIIQNTLLQHVNPGRQNIEEIIGAVITFGGAVSSPIYLLSSRLCKKEMMYSLD